MNGRTAWGVIEGCDRTAVISGRTPQASVFTVSSLATNKYLYHIDKKLAWIGVSSSESKPNT